MWRVIQNVVWSKPWVLASLLLLIKTASLEKKIVNLRSTFSD